ncbi:unnamed protein product (macronuclear) [Paramecium tetraurelia]|uniref:Choline transporter-like protein n=1 Tax=Paramecium tetraurelia TaxID=5888 RepID=A0BEC0_PARTE|nr:uncharacterized protein GSPATT00027920001 [Paramecium tetraurelia]CAK56887.1 unnamed protein product [Paramecium tetraurelia]|eukprot:XP_001424285.1 hypothetical protein (macronuclear) [Paramecium tetraurelia strain d4-2]
MITDAFLEKQSSNVRVQVQEEYEYPEQDVNFTGRKLTKELKNGPIEIREFKNINWIILYFVIWVLMIYCAITAWGKGNIYDIYMPYDCMQRQCGSGVTKDYPNVYILSELEYYCVSHCPGISEVGLELPCYQCSAKPAPYSAKQFFTLCVPPESENPIYQKMVSKINYFGDSQLYYADIQETWPIILVCAGIAFIISAIVLLLARFAAGCVVWGMVVLIISILAWAGGACYLQAIGYNGGVKDEKVSKSLKLTAYVILALGIAGLILVIYFAKKIKQAIIILEAASDFIRSEWQIIFVPVFMQFIIIGVMAYWVVFSALIFSATSNENKTQNNPYVILYMDIKTFWQIALYLFGMGWNVCFLNALTQFVICTCCCYWYYSHQGCSRKGTIKKGFRNGLTKNLGSLLYGGVILSFMWLIKFIISQCCVIQILVNQYFYKCMIKINKHIPFICFCYLYTALCARCFDQVIKFLDKNAYTIIVLTGNDFCRSAVDAFYLDFRNSTRMTITQGCMNYLNSNLVGEIFQYLGIIFIGATSATLCYFTVKDKTNILDPFVPTLFVAVISGFIGSIFMSLYGYGVDTIMFCLIVDVEQNRNEGGPKSVPPILKKYALEEK